MHQPLVTRTLIASGTPKDTWRILRVLTGERVHSIVHVEISLDELNSSFIQDHNPPDLEPLSLAMSTALGNFINGVNVAKAFHSRKLKSP